MLIELHLKQAGPAPAFGVEFGGRLFTQKAIKMHFRPRVTQHGGGTKTAV